MDMGVIRTLLLTQLRGLQEKLKEQKRRIETGVDDLENGKGDRDSIRKAIILQEAKQILSSLRGTDERQAKELKSQALDQLKAVAKAGRESKVLLECLEAAVPQDLDTMMEAFNKVNQRVEELQREDFSR